MALEPAALATLADRPLGWYLHVPYCSSRCGYCDFNTYTATEFEPGHGRATWLESARREIDIAKQMLPGAPAISTVFFGGGTPTLLPTADLVGALSHLREGFGIASDAEVTTEANPDSVTPESLAELREGGFNRISFGMQSAAPRVLQVLDRTHTPGRAAQAVEWAVSAGFEHINLDLIYGSPGESEAELAQSLAAVLATGVDHLSAYALTLEDGTRMAAQVKRGEYQLPDDSVLAAKYEQVDAALVAAGFDWYEVSNWSRPGGDCRHNLGYWHNHNWWGTGPGAHSHIGGTRWWHHKHPVTWGKAVAAGDWPAAEVEQVSTESQRTEWLMLGIRLRTGLPAIEAGPAGTLAQLAEDGLLDQQALSDGRAVLTQRGRLLADTVIRELI